MGLRSFAAKHRYAVSGGLVVAIGLVIFVLVWFQPQKLFLNKTVNEAMPQAGAVGTASVAEPSVIGSGSFRSLEHHTTGTAKLVRLADGSVLLRFEDLKTSNGPVLRVYLSQLPADRGLHDYGERFVDVGALKGNRGDQNYRVPSGLDLSSYRSAVIWCKRFKVGFGVAPLR
jgi:hypothetical protein